VLLRQQGYNYTKGKALEVVVLGRGLPAKSRVNVR